MRSENSLKMQLVEANMEPTLLHPSVRSRGIVKSRIVREEG